MIEGRIIRGVSGFYDVLTQTGQTVRCKARGRFRKEHITPLVGDFVRVSDQENGYALLSEILLRKNELVRPPVANIDLLVIVLSASLPKPDFLLADKLLIRASLLKIEPLLVLNKRDDADEAVTKQFLDDYAAHFHTLLVSAVTREGVPALEEALLGRVSCFAGQSAVGKSSLLNALNPELSLAVGALSEKTEHGRHTTRKVELCPYRGGALLDTPGFSLYEPDEVTQEAIDKAYPEFGDAYLRCRFTQCAHIDEPDCAVKALMETGGLSEARYKRYVWIRHEIEQRRKHRYD